ncbi:hypothetical protein, partial [Methylobacterium isbiliense]|uniref:hypothetical protein n=1 Tax=Methylobacterium isbiliense TaxID=315478 RepID=UPI0025B4B548
MPPLTSPVKGAYHDRSATFGGGGPMVGGPAGMAALGDKPARAAAGVTARRDNPSHAAREP